MNNIRIPVKEVARIYGVSVPTIWRWTKTFPDFPKPNKIGSTTRWMLPEVQDHVLKILKNIQSVQNEIMVIWKEVWEIYL